MAFWSAAAFVSTVDDMSSQAFSQEILLVFFLLQAIFMEEKMHLACSNVSLSRAKPDGCLFAKGLALI